MSRVAENIIRLREGIGLSQTELALLSEIRRSTLNDIERGRNKSPGIDIMLAISRGISKAMGRRVLVDELASDPTDSDPRPSLTWFWNIEFSRLSVADRLRMRNSDSVSDRCAWCVDRLLRHFGLEATAERLDYSPEDLRAIASGAAPASDIFIKRLIEKANVPPDWPENGDPGALPSDLERLVRRIHEHHDGGTWTLVILAAIDSGVPPEYMARQVDAVRLLIPGKTRPPT